MSSFWFVRLFAYWIRHCCCCCAGFKFLFESLPLPLPLPDATLAGDITTSDLVVIVVVEVVVDEPPAAEPVRAGMTVGTAGGRLLLFVDEVAVVVVVDELLDELRLRLADAAATAAVAAAIALFDASAFLVSVFGVVGVAAPADLAGVALAGVEPVPAAPPIGITSTRAIISFSGSTKCASSPAASHTSAEHHALVPAAARSLRALACLELPADADSSVRTTNDCPGINRTLSGNTNSRFFCRDRNFHPASGTISVDPLRIVMY